MFLVSTRRQVGHSTHNGDSVILSKLDTVHAHTLTRARASCLFLYLRIGRKLPYFWLTASNRVYAFGISRADNVTRDIIASGRQVRQLSTSST